MAVTQQDLVDIFYDILREDEDVTAYPLTLTKLLLDAAQLSYCSGNIENPLTKETARKGKLPFLYKEKFYTNIKSTTLDGDITTSSTTIDLTDASDYPSSWYIEIEWNIIGYTGKSSNQLTWVTGILYDWEDSVRVNPVFELPSDYMSPINLIYNNVAELEQKQYDDIYEDNNSIKWWYDYSNNYNNDSDSNAVYWDVFYTIKDGKYILLYNLNESDTSFKLRYEMIPPAMSDTQWPIIDNDTYAKFIIPFYAVADMLYNRNEEARAWELYNYAMWKTKESYKFYNKQSNQKISWKQYKSAKSWLNI